MADEALKLTDAEVTFVAVPTEDDVPTSDIRELLVVETAGADTTSAEAQTMPVMGYTNRSSILTAHSAASRPN